MNDWFIYIISSNSSTKWFNVTILNSACGQSKYYKL